MRQTPRLRTLERQCTIVTSTQHGSLRAPARPNASTLEERKSSVLLRLLASIQRGARHSSATRRVMISLTHLRCQWACHIVRFGATWTAVMAHFAMMTLSVNQAAVATLSHSLISVACPFLASTVLVVTLQGTTEGTRVRTLFLNWATTQMNIIRKRHWSSTLRRGSMRLTLTMSYKMLFLN